jgi:hypothetical protein
MLENLLNIESLIAISVGAIFSFKIAKINLNLRSDVRTQSPNINGDNNIVIYNQAMVSVRKEMAFSVKVFAFVMMITFHMFPLFYVNLLGSLAFLLPLFSVAGVIYTIRLHGFSRGWDVMYPLAMLIVGVLFYCSSKIMGNYIDLYPKLYSIYEYISGYRFMGLFDVPLQTHDFFFVVVSSIACPALIVLGFYLSFAYTVARDGNDIFRFCALMIAMGYMAYLFLSGVMFSDSQGNTNYFIQVLSYPFSTLTNLFG